VSLVKIKTPINPTLVGSNVFSRLSKALNSTDMDFKTFLEEGWKILEPANKLVHSWYIDYLCEYLMLVTDGKIKKLLINMPPRNGKSNIVTVLWPLWSWTRKPWLRFIFCSYSSGLSVKHSTDRRRVMESPWFKDNWGALVNMADDQNQKQEYENTRRGTMVATSVGGTITGKGGDVIVEDDMINPMEAESEASRHHAISMHQNVLSTRLDNPMTGIRVVVEQRTHAHDLSAHILKNEAGWTRLTLPLRANEKTLITFPVSGRTIERKAGELLNPARQGEIEYQDIKKTMGTRSFVAQCQQDPTDEAGNILKREWWKFYKVLPDGFDCTIQSWDMTFKKTEAGSFVVGQVWKKRGPDFFLVDQFRERVDFTGSLTAMLSMTGKHIEATAKLVEEAANGPAIISSLQGRVPGIIAIKPSGTKLARAQAVAPLIESGHVHLPDPMNNPWVHDFIEECAAFNGQAKETNDQVDAMSQAISWMHELNYHVPEMEIEEGSFIGDQDQAAGGFY
jgi:predicted phage terminase large subunit-like protein